MAGLPEGMITASDSISGELNTLHEVDVDDVIKMWKVYSASKAILPDDTGKRLANFLWRVWGSDEILYNISGNQLSEHFRAISEDGPLRTTPTQSPRASRHISAIIKDSGARDSEAYVQLTSSTSNHSGEEGESTEVEARDNVPLKESRSVPMPASILKKPARSPPPTYTLPPRSSFSAAPSQGLSTATEEDEDASTPRPSGSILKARAEPSPQSTSLANRQKLENMPPSQVESSSTLRSASSEDTIKSRSEAASKVKRKKTVFHASNRKRPIGMRRKSSQSSTSATPSTISPRLSTAATSLASTSASSSDIPARKMNEPRKLATSIEENVIQTPDAELANAQTRSRQSSLVEPDFRSKFVDKARSAQSSYVNLPSLLRKPSATTATTSSHTTGTMDTAPVARSRVTFTEGSKPPGPAGPDIDLEDDSSPLPRTKSQLTLLLEKDRRAGGNGNGNGGKGKKGPS